MNMIAWVADPVTTTGLQISPTDYCLYMIVILVFCLFFFLLMFRK